MILKGDPKKHFLSFPYNKNIENWQISQVFLYSFEDYKKKYIFQSLHFITL